MAVSPGSQTSTVTRVPFTAGAGTLLAAASGRKRFVIVNEGAGNLYVLLGGTGTVSATNYSYKLAAGGLIDEGSGSATYAGIITAVGDASGNAQVTWW